MCLCLLFVYMAANEPPENQPAGPGCMVRSWWRAAPINRYLSIYRYLYIYTQEPPENGGSGLVAGGTSASWRSADRAVLYVRRSGATPSLSICCSVTSATCRALATYMCICTHIYMYIYICTHTHTHTHTHIFIYICIYIYVYIYIYAYIYILHVRRSGATPSLSICCSVASATCRALESHTMH